MEFPKKVLISGRVRTCLNLVLEQNIKNKTIVDIGSSFGWLEKELLRYGPKKVIGIEMNEDAVKFARKNIKESEFIVGDALNLPLKKNFADIAILFDVIEHVPKNSEIQVLNEVNRILKKRGLLLLSTPNNNLFANLFDIAWYFGHRHYFKDEINKILETAGFKVLKIQTRGSIFSSIYLTWFYIFKRLLNTDQPRSKFFEKLDDLGYQGEGITDIFLIAQKIS